MSGLDVALYDTPFLVATFAAALVKAPDRAR